MVPKVYWSYTRSRVLTLEFLEGFQLADIDTMPYGMEERRRLAEVITEAWMTMIFRHGVFGDPHPANILVMRPDQIGLVDFGLAGKLTDEDLSKAGASSSTWPTRTSSTTETLADLGVRYPKENEDEFVAELQELFYRYYGASLARSTRCRSSARCSR